MPDSRDEQRRAEEADLVAAVRAGDEDAFGRLYDAWFDRCFDVACRILRDSQAAADVAQDAFLSAWRNLDSLDDPEAFGGWLLRIARNRSLDRLARDKRSSPVDAEGMAVIEDTHPSPASAPAGFGVEDRLSDLSDPEQAAYDAELRELVWEAADALGARDASVLDLHLRHGLKPAEIADVIEVSPNTAKQIVHRLRDRLGVAVRARMLWHGGDPACDALSQKIEQQNLVSFDAAAVSLISSHTQSCDACSERERLRVEPGALFAAIPIAVAPFALKAKAAYALAGEGVPMDGSSALDAAAEPRSDPSSSGRGGGRGNARRWLVAAAVLAIVFAAAAAVALVAAPTAQDEAGLVVTSPTPSSAAPGPELSPDSVAPDVAAPAPDGADSASAPEPPAETSLSIASLAISPAAIGVFYPIGSSPTLAWSVSGGGGSVEMTGPDFYSTSSSGAAALCPGPQSEGTCLADPGSYTYVLHTYDEAGAMLDVRSVTLTIS